MQTILQSDQGEITIREVFDGYDKRIEMRITAKNLAFRIIPRELLETVKAVYNLTKD